MNIIFLDFDGVLIPFDSNDGKDYFALKFNQSCVDCLSEIISATKSKIVITSSWANHFSIFLLKIMWKYRNMPGPIIGKIRNNSYDRSQKIDTWLKKHTVTNYIIIDDMAPSQFEEHHQKHLVHTNTRIGLTKNEVKLAIKLLLPIAQ
ncbi:MAG: hypothetical protein HDR74_05395 [Bacteroides sp.]|nr:hypothetical protein [Bacteroides sp.]